MKGFTRFTIIMSAGLLAAAGVFFSACKSKPLPVPEAEPRPAFDLLFRNIEADDPERLRLFFDLEARGPLPSGGRVRIVSWRVESGGEDASSAFSLDYPQGDFSLGSPAPLSLDADMASLAAKGLAPRDEYSAALVMELELSRDSAPPERFEVLGRAAFPGVRAPEFHITGIAVIKAELINTRFRVGLTIDNPNPFPLELSAFTYELYGNGRYWAGGTEKNVLRVAGNSSLSGNLFLIMNFIGMERSLLDQIANLQDVDYHFSGNVQVGTGIEYLPVFTHHFDFEGYSQVLDK